MLHAAFLGFGLGTCGLRVMVCPSQGTQGQQVGPHYQGPTCAGDQLRTVFADAFSLCNNDTQHCPGDMRAFSSRQDKFAIVGHTVDTLSLVVT